MTNKYTSDFVAALAELGRMEAERNDLEIKIAKQKKKTAALGELANLGEDSPVAVPLVVGITDACRTVLRGAERALFPVEIRDRVQALGLPPQANLLASVHTVVRRLIDSGEVVEVSDPLATGSTAPAYKWVPLTPGEARRKMMAHWQNVAKKKGGLPPPPK